VSFPSKRIIHSSLVEEVQKAKSVKIKRKKKEYFLMKNKFNNDLKIVKDFDSPSNEEFKLYF
jgi:hypothetical protein